MYSKAMSLRSRSREYNFYDDSIRVILRHLFYEYYYSPHKLAFQNIMRVGDQKLMIDLEWPNNVSQTPPLTHFDR